MKITGQGPLNPFKMYQQQQAQKNKNTQARPENDRVELSSEAQHLQELTRLAEALPEMRTDLVNEIKDRLQAGTYEVSPQQLAASIMAFMRQEQ